MNLENYYQYFSTRQFPRDAQVYLWDDTHFAIEKDGMVRVFLFNENECDEVTVFFKSQFDYIRVFENGHILTASKGEASVYYLGKLCHSFEYKPTCNLVSLHNAVKFIDVSNKTEIFFVGRPYKTASELVSTYLEMKDGFTILQGDGSDFESVFLKVQTKDASSAWYVFSPLEQKKTDFSVIRLPNETNQVELLKNGNFIVRFWSCFTSSPFGCALYDSKGTPLLSSVEEFGIMPLADKCHCVYQNALLVDENGSFIDEYRNELAVSKNGYKIYAYTIDYGSKNRKGFWPGKTFKLSNFKSNSDLFCFWNSGRFFMVPLSEEFFVPIKIHCDRQYAMRVKQVLGL